MHSSPTTHIPIGLLRWKNSTTMVPTQVIWRLKSVIQILNGNLETVSTSVFVTHQSECASKLTDSTTTSKILSFWRQPEKYEDGLTVAEYVQGTTRYAGTEARFDAAIHPAIWLNLGPDYVNAKLTQSDTPLPRIPPLRGRVGLELRFKSLLVNPEKLLWQITRTKFSE